MLLFERKVSTGEVVTVIVLLISAGAAYGSVTGRLNALESFMHGLVSLEKTMIRLETKLDERAKSDEKLEKKLERIEERLK
jgi:ABC-type histidine transport system ATPase subunit